MQAVYCLYLLLFCSPLSWGLIGKSDKKAKGKPSKTTAAGARASLTIQQLLNDAPSAQEILDNHASVCLRTDCLKQRNFQRPVLGYVTPWNNHGYDVAKMIGAKMDLVAPVWLQVSPDAATGCAVRGQHDVDAGWMDAVRATHRQSERPMLLVPRLLFEGWLPADIDRLNDDNVLNECVELITGFLQHHQFDGATVEIFQAWPPTTASDRRTSHFISHLAQSFHKHLLRFVLVIPSVDFQTEHSMSLITEMILLLPYVTYFSVNMYDFVVPHWHRAMVAPLNFVRANLDALFKRADNIMDQLNKAAAVQVDQRQQILQVFRSKVLLGINFYGLDCVVPGEQCHHVIGSQFLQLLQQYGRSDKFAIKYEKEFGEHYFEYRDAGKSRHVVTYPTLLSIAHRMQLATEQNIGVAVWEIGQGLDYFYDLF